MSARARKGARDEDARIGRRTSASIGSFSVRSSKSVDFGNRVLKFEQTDPQLYVGECANGIFSLLKKEYDTPRKRALAATARLKQMPALLEARSEQFAEPVKLYAQLAIESARSIDPLFNESLMTLGDAISPPDGA